MAKRGKLIVLDGIDKVGKETQSKLLAKRLNSEGIPTKVFHFPRYEHNFFGKLIKESLQGKYGSFLSLHAKTASVLYAADRFESREEIEKLLTRGVHVVSDRYVSSNQIHQGGKIRDKKERRNFLKWLNELEYGVFKIPKPDLVIHLSMPLKQSHMLMRKAYGDKITAKADTVERNLTYYRNSESAARELSREEGWHVINCAHKGEILPISEVHEQIYNLVQSEL